jgi:hypothetical protein
VYMAHRFALLLPPLLLLLLLVADYRGADSPEVQSTHRWPAATAAGGNLRHEYDSRPCGGDRAHPTAIQKEGQGYLRRSVKIITLLHAAAVEF